LVATLLVGVTSSAEYDPWFDVNDDGIINILDILALAVMFGEEGTPINKTELLLELQDRIDSLNLTLETRVPQKGNISVSAADFSPWYATQDYESYGWSLFNRETSQVNFVADVQLPHGATVTNFTIWGKDDGSLSIRGDLYNYGPNGKFPPHSMAYISSPQAGAPGEGSWYDDTIYMPVVDNNGYAYYLQVSLPGWSNPPYRDYILYLAFIEWEYLP